MKNGSRHNNLLQHSNGIENNLLTPYYSANQTKNQSLNYSKPLKFVNLNAKNLPGIPTIISGRIYTKDKQIVPNAKIEIWHADDVGAYNNEGNFYFPSQTTLSGCIFTDASGTYKIKTIRPGIYGYRARHFHYKISAKGHHSLETQIYFKDDPRILIDEIALVAENCRIIDFRYSNMGNLEGIVDVFLPKI
ncbi:Dioxygenase [Aquimarina amphilecti]|uniref:Dioxygenase n=1 Tax=Aquimarina amphilecti TaxID=1038014 RepID=A0A1H7KD23_AQUAM|nr:hypothetical protein [Aquimarina amphilecti]SEK84743.1 Dioxygenase [Aquimarina amphilecti]